METTHMPKVLVLFYGVESPASALAEAAADGATSVRFTEVDLRAGNTHRAETGRRIKVLESADQLGNYHGIVVSAPAAGDVPSELDALLDTLERQETAETFSNTVFAVLGGENTVLLGRVSRLGGIIVTEPRAVDDPEAHARGTGKRVAKVVEWVRHALSHEHGHTHTHSHSHEHVDDHHH
jgi:hypothetical protein